MRTLARHSGQRNPHHIARHAASLFRGPALFLLGLALLGPPGMAQAGGSAAKLDRTQFGARGRNEAVLTIGKFGRYAVLANSKQGTALQLVDRMMGPGEPSGEAGKLDGRLDSLLDAGAYKVVATSHEKGQGSLTLTVKPFSELNRPKAPVLLELAAVDGKLEDFQQISYWIEIKQRKTVYLEAQGRDLSDLRLWLEGNWLLDSDTYTTQAVPVLGRPETNCLIIADLNPGYYLLTAYGGPAKAWPRETGEHPFHLRYGIPQLDYASRIQETLSPFGVDRFVVPKRANYFLLQLAQKKDFKLETKAFEPGNDLEPYDAVASISKKSQDPECRIQRSSFREYTLVTILGPPGETYVFQCFEKKDAYSFSGSASYWIGTLHSGYMDDNIDATAILVSDARSEGHVQPAASDVIHVGASTSWARRFNLLGQETLFFFVEETGDYEIHSTGTDAEFKFEPFMISTPENYRSPDFKPGNSTWALDKGYWVLTLNPKLNGIAIVEVRRKGGLVNAVTGLFKPEGEIKPGPAKGACQMAGVQLDSQHSYSLYVNRQEGVDHGVVLRNYPPDLGNPLPVVLVPGEEIVVPFSAAEAGRFTVSATPGGSFTASLDSSSCAKGCAAEAGAHKASVKNTGDKTLIFTLALTPARLLPGAPQQPLPTEVEAKFAKFQTLTPGSPLFWDFERNEKKTALLDVEAPALYRIETTGLLNTGCAIRTRCRPKLFSDQAGGVGRNCLVQAYLKAGEYQVTVQTLGQSRGHAGLRATRTSIAEGVPLILGKDVREDVPSGSAVQYTFTLPKAGEFHVQTLGVGKVFRCRLEDKDGWPLQDPTAKADFTFDFQPGGYRYMTLPWDVDTLRCTRVEEVLPPRSVEGRGPHILHLNESLENLWREPKEGAARERDLYDIFVPATVDAHVKLGQEQMQAYITRKEGAAYTVVDVVPPGKSGWSGKLTAGAYRLEVECSRNNDRLPYSVLLTVDQLVPGLSKDVSVPTSLPVSVSGEGIVEIASSGTMDVRAKLFHDGQLVDSNDDAYNDWNFRIARKLEPGDYTLVVEPVGGTKGTTRVSMGRPDEAVRPALALPFDQSVELEGKIIVYPIAAADGGVISVRASGSSFLGCVLEKAGGGKVRVLAQRTGRACELDVPAEKSGSYQLRLWSADHQSETARLQVIRSTPPTLPVEGLQAGRALSATPGAQDTLVQVQVSNPGTFRIRPIEGFSFSTGEDEPLSEPPSDLVTLPTGTATLKWKASGQQAARAQAERFVLAPGEGNAVKLGIAGGRPWWLDVASEAGGFIVLTASAEPGAPGCALVSGPPPGGDLVLSRSYAFFENGCVAVGLPGTQRARVWNSEPGGSAVPGFTVALRAFAKPAEPEKPLPLGHTEGELKADGQVSYALPAGPKRLDLALERGLVAVLWDEGRVEAVASAISSPAGESFHTSASRLTLLSLCEAPALFGLGLLKAPPPALPFKLKAGGLFEEVFAQPGTATFEIGELQAGTKDLMLFSEGRDVSCAFMDEAGCIYRGSRIALDGRRGFVRITHGAGLVKAWLSQEKDALATRWGHTETAAPSAAEANSVQPLEGGL